MPAFITSRPRVTAFALAASISIAASAGAQEQTRERCPDITERASAADQALCWFERDRRSDASCAGEPGVCVEHASAWCEDAALDDPRVGNACFLAPLRAGRYEEAAEIGEYLAEPTTRASKCRDALTGLIDVRVVTIPRGGEVSVGGRKYGAAPVEVRLPRPWWTQTVTVKFGETTVEAGSDAIKGAFDERVCEMGDLVIEGPETEDSADMAEPQPPSDESNVPLAGSAAAGGSTNAIPQDGKAAKGGSLDTVGWIMIGTGAAALAGGAIFGGLAIREKSDLDSHCGASVGLPKGRCAADAGVDSIADRLGRYRNLTWALLGVGAAAAAAGGTLLWLGGDDEPERQLTPAAACGVQGCTATLRGVF